MSACLAVLGLIALSFLLGAGVMYFQLPSSGFLTDAFRGAEAWHERGRSTIDQGSYSSDMAQEGVTEDKPDQAFDGFTLFTTVRGSHAKLIDMRGNAAHEWELPFGKAWPSAPHVTNPLPEDQIHWFRCRLYPNGDLLAIYHADGDTPYGYGLVKVNKDSELLWAYAGNAHHDLDLADDGTIYTLGQKLLRTPPDGFESLPGPLIADSVVVLSPDGKEQAEIPILEAFRDSPYAGLLRAALDVPQRSVASAALGSKGDFIHANSVRVLRPAVAPKFPLFKPGQLLISLRTPSILAVLDVESRTITWAARGVWQAQHDSEFLDNGHLLLFDNCGSNNGSRVLEYDPLTQAIPWAYSSEKSIGFRAASRGMKQRLPNGNTLILDPDHWMLLEVTQDKQLAWEYNCGAIVTGANRYRAEELTFLPPSVRARP
jgi:hypothetical protein